MSFVFDPETPPPTGIFDPFAVEEENPGSQYSTPELWYRSNVALLAARRNLGEQSPLIQDLLAGFETAIGAGHEPSINKAVAQARKTNQRVTVESMIGEEALKKSTDEGVEFTRALIEYYQRRDEQEEDRYAMDKAAGEEIVQGAIRDPSRAAVMLAEAKAFGNTADFLETLDAKMKMMQQLTARVSKRETDQSIAWDVVDFFASFVPHPTANAMGDLIVPGGTNILDPGTSILTAQHLFYSNAISIEQAEALIPKIEEELENASSFLGPSNITLMRKALQDFNAMSSKDVLSHNLIIGAEIVTLPLIAVTKVLSRSVIGASRLLGNRAAAKELASSTIHGNQTGVNANAVGVDEALDAMWPTAQKTTEDLVASPGIGGEVSIAVADNRTIIEEIMSTVTAQSLSPEAQQAAAVRAWDRLRAELPKDVWTDFDIVPNPVTKTRELVAHIGQIDGMGGFASSKAALAEAARRGFEKVTVSEADGLFFIKMRRPITEDGIADAFELEAVSSSALRSFLSGADTLLPRDIRNATHLATDTRTKLSHSVQKLQKKMTKGINKDAQRRLTVAIDESAARKEWLTASDLKDLYRSRFNRDITNKELIAYATYKDINDVGYYIRNSGEYAKRQRSGTESIVIDSPDFSLDLQNARVFDNITVAPESRYWTKLNGLDKIETFSPGEMTAETVQKLLDDGYKIVKLEKSFVKDGYPIEWILSKTDNLEVRALNPIQLNYVAGGHRMYEGKRFIKQAVFRLGANGRKLVMNPRTYHVFVSPTAGKAYVAKLEAARLAYGKAVRGEISEDVATMQIQEAGIGVGGFDDLKRLVDKDEFEVDVPFELVDDRAMPTAMSKELDEFEAYSTFNPDLEGASGWYADTGRMFYSSKGERLRDPQGDFSPILDPFRTSQLAIDNAIRMRAFGDYRTRAVASWLKTFGGHIKVDPTIGSDVQRFLQATVTTSDSRIAAKANGTRLTLKRMLSTRTKDSEWMSNGMKNLGEWLDASSLPGTTKLGKITMDNQDANPLAALKSFAFDLYLGLFDASQLILQPMTLFASMSVNPKLGFPSFASMPWLRYTMRNTSDDFLNLAAKRQAMTGTGLSPEQFKAMVLDLRASGKGEISGELAVLDTYSNPQVGWWGARGVKRVRDLGRLPFFEAERMVRLTAYGMAWREWHQLNPKAILGQLGQEGSEFVAKRTNDYSLSMTSASSAWWQRGVLSVPTQFLGYSARMMEAMLPVKVGGSDAFTGTQKFSLAAGQLALFGTAGVPAAPWVLEMYQNATGTVPDPDTYRALTGGMIDTIIYNASGDEVDSNWALRGGSGGQLVDFISNMFGEDRSVAMVVGGPVLNLLSDGMEVLHRIGTIANAEVMTTGEMTAYALNELASLASSWSRYTRAKYIWDYGIYISRKGQIDPGVRATKMEAVAVALGVPLRKVNDRYSMQEDVSELKQYWRDQAKALASLRNRALVEPENAERYAALIQGIFSSLPDRDRVQIIKIAARLTPRDGYFRALKEFTTHVESRSASAKARANLARQSIKDRTRGEE